MIPKYNLVYLNMSGGEKKKRGHEEIICSVVADKYLTTRFPVKVGMEVLI